jgi:hypothetical protein
LSAANINTTLPRRWQLAHKEQKHHSDRAIFFLPLFLIRPQTERTERQRHPRATVPVQVLAKFPKYSISFIRPDNHWYGGQRKAVNIGVQQHTIIIPNIRGIIRQQKIPAIMKGKC